MASVVEIARAQTPETDLPTPGAAQGTTVLEQRPGLSTETVKQHADTRNHAARVGRVRPPSAATTAADNRAAIRRAEAPAWAAEERAAEAGLTVAVAEGLTSRRYVVFKDC